MSKTICIHYLYTLFVYTICKFYYFIFKKLINFINDLILFQNILSFTKIFYLILKFRNI